MPPIEKLEITVSHQLHEIISQKYSDVTPLELAYKHFNNIWSDAQKQLNYIIKIEAPHALPRIYEERSLAVRHFSKLYLRYIRVCNNFIKCYENIVHPQKRRYLKKLINVCIGRLLELKHELVSLEKSEFQFIDHLLLDFKMSPSDMDVQIPGYFKEPQTLAESEKKVALKKILDKTSCGETQVKTVPKEEKYVRMAMVYIQMIQSHERARQEREQFREIWKKRALKDLWAQRENRKDMQFSISKNESAIVIQKAWRRFLFHKKLNAGCAIERDFLNMQLARIREAGNWLDEFEKDRSRIAERNEKEYLTRKEKLKEEMLTYDGPRLMEALEGKVRAYFHDYNTMCGEFPEYPPDEEGGSDGLFTMSVKPPPEKKKKGDKKDQKDKKEEKDKKGKKEEDKPVGHFLQPSKYLPLIVELSQEYEIKWANTESIHFDKFDAGMLEEEVAAEVRLILRSRVDEKMRSELERLTAALRKDTKKKGKKKKGKKKGKKGKRKKEVDLTPDRTLESLVEELVNNGIIIQYPVVALKDFWGEYNYSGSVQHLSGDTETYPLPCLGDVRRIVNEYCILPMGSEEIHLGGAYVKSILLVGPQGSGKTTLVYAVCNAIGATLMDLSPRNIQGKYPGPEGLKMLSHLVSKVSRLVQPTVIFIKDAEAYFWKKKPKGTQLTEAGRLKKELPKLIKKIKHPDRILVFGISDLPFASDQKKINKCYQKIICVFKPDYNCRGFLWHKMISKHRGHVPENLDVSVLSNVSDGFTAAQIESAVKKVLNGRRVDFQEKIPLSATDFALALADYVPVYDEQHQEYKSWMLKTTICKKRKALLELETEEIVEEEEEEDDYGLL